MTRKYCAVRTVGVTKAFVRRIGSECKGAMAVFSPPPYNPVLSTRTLYTVRVYSTKLRHTAAAPVSRTYVRTYVHTDKQCYGTRTQVTGLDSLDIRTGTVVR